MKPNFETLIKNYWPYLLAAVVVLFVLSPIRKLLMSSVDGVIGLVSDPNRDQALSDLEKGLSDLPNTRSLLLHDPMYYRMWANRMYSAMDKWQPPFLDRFSDDQMTELEGLNAAELKEIIREFGVKRKETFMGAIHQLTGTLIEWLNDELTGDERERMKKIFKKTGLWS